MRGPQAAAQMANVLSRSIGAQAQSNASVRNANTQIGNQESMYNAQTQRADTDFNLANIRQTFTNNVRAQQYRNEELANGFNQSLNNAASIQGRLDDLNQNLTAQSLPYLTNVYLDQSGNIVGQGDYSQLTPEQQSRVASAQQMSPIGLGRNRLPYATGFGSLNSVQANQGTAQMAALQQEAFQRILNSGDPRAIAYALRDSINQYKPNAQGNTPYSEMLSSMYRPAYPR
jgi:hypothetical protein